ncbi:MAG TPA: hypothetical protein VLE27_02845 [Thermoanaerobaculia bacterium]|nr:hypothetical protein [Thermoanaerobaculia bacterium]
MTKIKKNPLEWVVFGIGLILTLGVIAALTWDAASGERKPPDLTVELGAPEPRSQGWAVPVTVRNEGEETAEGAQVLVSLELPGGGKEEAELEIPFVPRRSKREGWVLFLHPPASGRLSGRVTGYEQP